RQHGRLRATAGVAGVDQDRSSRRFIRSARQYAGERHFRFCRSRGQSGFARLAAAQGDCALDPVRGRNPAQPWQRRERPRPGDPRIRPAECGARRRSDHQPQSRNPADDQRPARLAFVRDRQQGPGPSTLERMMTELKLSKLPDRTPVKIAIMVSPGLNQALNLYAEAYRDAYGQAEPVAELIPAMLASFLEGDRTFAQRRKKASSSS